jgi:hypothetical protein
MHGTCPTCRYKLVNDNNNKDHGSYFNYYINDINNNRRMAETERNPFLEE